MWPNVQQSSHMNTLLWSFGCLNHLVSEHGNHFINWTIEILNEEFMITHHNLTTYYLERNGQAKLINKILGKILAKLVYKN
jgi:hypothetical protein